MADHQAINTTCQAVMTLLEQNVAASFTQPVAAQMQFKVCVTEDFENKPVGQGVSLFVYHVAINQVQRSLPPRRPKPPEKLRRPQLPIDVHFILTPWATEASMQLTILGWMMRTLEDFPSLSAGMLNTTEDVFEDDEVIEVVAGQLSNEEMFRIWDVLPGSFHISVPYVARVLKIESRLEDVQGQMVLTRDLDFGVVKN